MPPGRFSYRPLGALSVGEYKGPVEMPALHFTWTMGNGIVLRVSFRGGRPLSHGRWGGMSHGLPKLKFEFRSRAYTACSVCAHPVRSEKVRLW